MTNSEGVSEWKNEEKLYKTYRRR